MVDCNIKYLNPARRFLSSFFMGVGHTHFYGPGYVSLECLNEGILKYAEEFGPFDFVVVTSTSLRLKPISSNLLDASFKFFTKCFSFDFSKKEFVTFFNYKNDIINIPHVKRIAFLSTFDFHVLEENDCSTLITNFDLVVGYNKQHSQFSSDLDQISLAKEGRHGSNGLNSWAKMVREYPKKIFPYLNYSLPNEFHYSSHNSRSNDWIVPGTRYSARKEAFSNLKKMGVKVQRDTKKNQFIKVLKYFFKILNTSDLLMIAHNEEFISAIRKSKFGYTCGSAFDMPIRKIFEIPAAGALLIIKPFSSVESLECIGWKHLKNCIMSDPGDLAYWVNWITKNPIEAQKIAHRGQRLVLEKHNFECRISSFRKALDLLSNGNFFGAEWHDGEIVFNNN